MKTMALEQSDRELLDLIISQRVREAMTDQRASIIDDTVAHLVSDSRFAALESQLRDKVECSVETTLKRRYTAVAFVTAALVGGGAAAMTQAYLTSINHETTDLLGKNKAELDAYHDFMVKSREDLRNTTKLFDPLKEDIESNIAVISTQNAVTEAQQRHAEQTLTLLADTTKTLGLLKSEADELIQKTGGKSAVSKDDIIKLQEDVSRLQASMAPSRYRIFLHFGNRNLGPELEAKIKAEFSENGFIVVGTDRKDDFGGSGIDYFYDRDCIGAQKVRELLLKVLPRDASTPPLRKQSVINQPGTLGVWITSKTPQAANTATC
jgi:hypothetical protein